MIRFLIVRFTLIFVTLFVVSLAIFGVTEVLPGDVAEAVLGKSRTPGALETLREQMGLDRPAWQRYADWDTRCGARGSRQISGTGQTCH